MLSQHDIPLNLELLFGFLSFWSYSVNGFILLSGVVSPILLDVVTITGLPIIGDDVPSLFELSFSALKVNFSKNTSSYSNFLAANAKTSQ